MQARILAIAASVAVVTCGGEDTPPTDDTCEAFRFASCGGDVVGTWSLELFCGQFMSGFGVCADMSSTGLPTLEETLTLKYDGTYSALHTAHGSTTTHFPAACVNALAGSTDARIGCTSLSPEYGSCQWVTDRCDCTMYFGGSAATSGQFVTMGTTLIMRASGGEDQTMQYCVKDGVLTTSLLQNRRWYVKQ